MAKIQAIRKEAMELHIRDVSKTMKIKILFAGLLTMALFTERPLMIATKGNNYE